MSEKEKGNKSYKTRSNKNFHSKIEYFMKKGKKTFFERWPYYLFAYVIGYLYSLKVTGIPSAVYLIPIKLIAFLFALTFGTAMYHGIKKTPLFTSQVRFFKYLVFIIFTIIIFSCLEESLATCGIDISPFMGFSK